MKNRKKAGLLAIFLGWMGVHKFYLGEYGKGILYFIFYATLIPFILSIFEGINILTMDDSQFQEKYIENIKEDKAAQDKAAQEQAILYESKKLKKQLELGVIDEETYNSRINNLN